MHNIYIYIYIKTKTIYIYIYIHNYADVCVCIYLSLYIYIYIYTYIHERVEASAEWICSNDLHIYRALVSRVPLQTAVFVFVGGTASKKRVPLAPKRWAVSEASMPYSQYMCSYIITIINQFTKCLGLGSGVPIPSVRHVHARLSRQHQARRLETTGERPTRPYYDHRYLYYH